MVHISDSGYAPNKSSGWLKVAVGSDAALLNVMQSDSLVSQSLCVDKQQCFENDHTLTLTSALCKYTVDENSHRRMRRVSRGVLEAGRAKAGR